MSREVDERVVEMRFDNAQFEKNVKQSQESLEKLNRSLQLDGAEKGFEKIADASAKVDFDQMQGAVETLSDKFSAMEVIGVAALVKITNQAIDTGEKLVKSLSVDQVTAGWGKYAQKTASVQTIMNATGKSITKVNSYLDKLMWYSDETSYGFTDMTASLGQLTAAVGDIDKLVPMIMGIANATAYAGKGASEFSRVIYNLNQSYSQGYLNLMDWKSVELAGVATAELKQLLIDTAVEQGKLEKGQVSIGTFGSTLKDQWADKEVMESAFGKLAEFTEAVKAGVDSKQYKTAAEAIDALADQYDEATVKAFKAAQEAKSFTEAVDATKDAVSSGWMETFDILFGNYEEAKGFWTDLSNSFWDIFASGADARNSWLKSAFDSGLDQLLGTEGFGDAADNYTNLLQKALMNVGLVTEDDIEEAGSFQKALEGSGVTAQQLYAVVKDAADGYARMAALSDRELNANDLDRDKVEALAQAYATMAENIQNGSVRLDEYAGKMNQLSGREHFFNGILNILEGINSVLEPIRNAFSDVFMTDGSPLYNLLKGFDALTGKMKLSEESAAKLQKVFKGVFSVVNVGLKAVKVVVKTVLTVVEKLLDILSPIKELLLDIGSRVGDVLSWVNESMGQAESLTDVLAILAGAIAALVSPITEVWKGFKSFVRGGDITQAKTEFGAFGVVVNTVGSVLDKFKMGSVSAGGIIGTAFKVLGGVLLAAFDGVGTLIGNAFNGLKTAGKTVETFKDEQVTNLENIRDTVVSLPEKAQAALRDFGSTMGSVMNAVATACRTALNAVKDFFNLQDGVDLYRLLALIDVGALAGAIWAIYKGLNGVSKTIKKISDDLKNPVTKLLDSMRSAIDAWTKQHTTTNFVSIAKGISIAIGALSASIYLLSKIEDPTKAAQALGSVIALLFGLVIAMQTLAKADVSGLDSAKIFAVISAFAVGLLAATESVKGLAKAMKVFKYFSKDQMNNAVGALMSIAAVLTGMVGVIGLINYLTAKLQASSKIKMNDPLKGMSAYIAVATALVEVCGALYLIGNLDEGKLQNAYGAILTLGITMTAMVAVVGALNKWNNELQATSKNKLKGITDGMSAFLVVAASLVVVAGAVKLFAGIENLDNAMGAALGSLVALAGVIAMMSKFGGKAKKMLAGAKAMVTASAALAVFAGAVIAMNKAMGADTEGAGFAGISIGLMEMAGALYLLGKRAPESMAAAAALVAMGAALIEMAVAIKMISELSVPDLAKGVVALGAALFGLVAAAGWLPTATAGIAGVAGACLMLATALLLTPAFKGLASLSLSEVVAGVVGMAGMLVGLYAIGANPAIAVGFGALSVSLISLAKAFSVFAGGLIKLSVAIGILELVSLFAGPIKEVIVGAAEDIKVALETIVVTICAVINDCAEPISEALTTICKILIQSFVDVIAWAWEGEGGEGDGIKGALDQLWENIIGWIKEKAHWDSGSSIFDLSSWIDTFTADDRPIGKLMNKIFGDDISEAGKGLIEQLNGTGEDMGANLSKGTANGISENAPEANDAGADMAQTTVDAAAEAAGVQSPSWKTYEIGNYLAQGLANGLTAPESMEAVTTAAETLSNAAETKFRNYWGIHSPSTWMETISKFIPEGFREGLTGTDGTAAIGEGISGMVDTAGSWLDKLFPGLLDKAKGYGTQLSNALTSGKSNYAGMPGFDEWYQNELSAFTKTSPKGSDSGLTDEDLYEDAKKDPDDKDKTPATTGKTKSSSGTKKTVAQQIEEKYKTQLEANKTLREIADNEYELWLTENENTASADELLAKRTENAAAQIANQTERVAIAQAKYDEMTKRWGADKQETKEAYNDLLQEQTSLAKLKADQYTNLFEQVSKRYDTDLDTLEKEYNLWTAQTDGTASELDKIDRETQYMTDELEVKLKKEAKAKEQWEILKDKHGKEDLRTKEAYNDWLDAQTESLELQNEIAKQGLEKLDKKLEQISDVQSRMQTRMQLLDSIYDDGSLADRADAYKQAVETYGENSAEAQKAKFQGITTSILGTVGALQSMTSELQTTYELQKLLNEGLDANGNKVELSADDRKDYEDKLLSSRSALVGFAGNLADAMNLNDTGKKFVVKLANAIQKNWSKISDGMNAAFAKLPQETQDTLTNVFGAMFSEVGTEVGTEFISAIASAMQGDYVGALVSAMTGIIDLLGTYEGQQFMMNLTNALASALPNLQNGAGQIADAVGQIGEAVNGAGGLAGILGTMTTEGGGAAAAVGGLGEAMAGLGSAIASALPELLIVVGVIAAIAALIAGIAGFIGWKKKQRQQKNVSQDIGSEIDQEIADGVKEDGPVIGDAVDEVTEDAMTVAKNTLAAVSRVLDTDYDYTPQITPVVDLTNVVEGAEEIDSTFAATKSLCLDGDVSRNLASRIDTEVQLQNGMKNRSNDDTLAAINALGGHMDGIAENIRNMKLTINGRKTIGYIDDQMGRLAGAKI